MVNWDKRLVELSRHVSEWSKDVTKVGAVIADSEHRVVSMGYNGLPSGCNDDIESRKERPLKYLYTEHAERNAIYSAAKNGIIIAGCTMYLMWFPCADCARAIIQSGIIRVVCSKPDLDTPKWGEHFKVSLEMFEEANVVITYV